MSKHECSLDDFDGLRNVNGFRREAHRIVARLVAEFPGHRDGARRRVRWSFEFRDHHEIAAKDGNRLFRKAVLFHFRLGVGHLHYLEWSSGPGNLQRDQVIVRRRVAVDVKAGAKLQREFRFPDPTGLRDKLLRRRDAQVINLGETEQWTQDCPKDGGCLLHIYSCLRGRCEWRRRGLPGRA